MKNKKTTSENFLENKPKRMSGLIWNENEEGKVTLEIENKGIMNRIAQKLFKKPKISYIHLDKMGSFIWKSIDGEKTIFEIGPEFKEAFGPDAEPLYERLAKYFQILKSYNFITLE